MLQSLHIHNFALIEDLHLTFGAGVTIFTGETGAGKSILLDAIGMLAGKRASASFIRHGTDFFLVEGAFFFTDFPQELAMLLAANHIEPDENQLIISRKFSRSGRGNVLVNGNLVPTAVLKHIGLFLLDIHGQFDNSLIFNPAYHVRILDTLTKELAQARERYNTLYKAWKKTAGEIQSLRHDESEKARMLSILAFQIKEIEEAHLKEGEDEALEEKIRKASHAEHIKNYLREAMFAVEGGEHQPGISEQIETLQRSLEKASAYDKGFEALAAKVETLSYEVEEIHDGLLQYAEDFDFDEQALDAMQSRLAAIEKLRRKYGATVADILQFLAKAKADYDRLDQSENELAKLEKRLQAEEKAARAQSDILLGLRKQAGNRFSQQMTATLKKLGIPHSRLVFHLEPMDDVNAEGAKNIELYFSANTGEDLQPLAKIASGGEVSRIALALKTASPEKLGSQTMIFDEIDVGISGQTGLQVADHIRKLSGRGQVFCITHLPQTAAIADHHYFIYKKEAAGRTLTQVRTLTKDEHVQEIARMFAGNDTTPASLTAARQIIAQVKEGK